MDQENCERVSNLNEPKTEKERRENSSTDKLKE